MAHPSDGPPVVLVVQPIHAKGIEMLESAGLSVKILGSDREEILEKEVRKADAMLVRTTQIPGKIIAGAEKLQIIAKHGIGTDNIDTEEAARRGILVTNTPEANSDSVAEHVIALLLALAKNIVLADGILRKGDFSVRERLVGVEVRGKTIGIVGVGRIGREQLGWMKRESYLINCARGAVVDEEALLEALTGKSIAGAAVDVYGIEPPPLDHPLLRLSNVVVSPHCAAHTGESLERMASDAAQCIVEFFRGQTPAWIVNQDPEKALRATERR